MNNLLKIFISILTCIAPYKGLCQTYTPLLNDLNEWYLTTCNINNCSSVNYFTNGDTVVDGVAYKVLDGFHYISRTFLIREDVANRKVYLKLLSSGKVPNEYLLYDFALNEGDAIELFNPNSPFPDEPGSFTLDSIRLKPLFDGNDYKHFYLTPFNSIQANSSRTVWVEGVGSLSLLNAPGGEPNYLNAGVLTCYFKDSELFYSNLDSINECTPSYYLKAEEIEKVKLSVNPTLISNYFRVKSDMQIIKIEVLSLTGSVTVNQFVDYELDTKVNMNSVPSGFYIVKINLKNGSIRTVKVVKY